MGRYTRIKDHAITRAKRSSDNIETGFKTTWDYAGNLVDSDGIVWYFNIYARDIGFGEGVLYSSPAQAQRSGGHAADIKGTGSSDEPNYIIDESKFWPRSMDRLLTKVEQRVSISYDWDHHPAGPGETSSVTFKFYPPMTPEVELEESDTHFTWTVKTLESKMGIDTNYQRSRTRYYYQEVTYSGGTKIEWPEIYDYVKDNAQIANKSVETFTFVKDYDTLSPVRPIAVRLAAVNDGWAGASAHSGTWEKHHVFAIPNKPEIVKTTVVDSDGIEGVFVDARSNADDWHPCEEMRLERLVASQYDASPDARWEEAQTIEDRNSIKTIRTLFDGSNERGHIAPDKATWYRVVTTHDTEINQATSAPTVSVYTNQPAKPTINSLIWEPENTILINATVESKMSVDTYVRVRNLTTGDEEVPGYKVSNPTNFRIYACTDPSDPDYGIPKKFDLDTVYQVEMYNVLTNEGQPAKYGELLTSEVAVELARGSAAAIAEKKLSIPTIEEIYATASGTGIYVRWTYGEEKIQNVDYTDKGTSIEWTSADGGWLSTSKPSTYKYEDDDGYGGSRYIEPVNEGKTYQVRLRRYLTVDGKDVYGGASYATITPWSTPDQPVLTAPGYVRAGEQIRYSWTFTDSGDSAQTAAVITINGVGYPIEGADGTYVFTVPEGSEGETYEATVSVSAGGGWSAQSNVVTTEVASPPTCTLALAGDIEDVDPEVDVEYGMKLLRSKPLSVTVGSDIGDMFRITITAVSSASAPEPSDGVRQASGDVVMTTIIGGTGTFEVDSSNIIGGGSYDVTAVAVDQVSGLESEPVTVGFTAKWEHAAAVPEGTVSIVDGVAYLVPVATEGVDTETDVCRIWRVTADGPVLACANAVWGAVYEDLVPPYSTEDMAYVFETVTADGGHAWTEVPYTYVKSIVTITYEGGNTVELPWNLTPSTTYKKTFERRSHLDGTRSGYWGEGVDIDWNTSSKVEKGDTELIRALRDLAQYDDVCYVRSPFGLAFPANVTVDITDGYNSAFTSCSVKCEQVSDGGIYDIQRQGERFEP